MFEIGWTELLVIAMVAIIVVGPKDLPRMLRAFGQTVGKLRRMAGEFQSTFNEALREAEQQADIADMRKQVESIGKIDPLADLRKSIQAEPAKAPQKKAAEATAAGGASGEAVVDGNGAEAKADAMNRDPATGSSGPGDAESVSIPKAAEGSKG